MQVVGLQENLARALAQELLQLCQRQMMPASVYMMSHEDSFPACIMILWAHMQVVSEDINEVLQASQQTHWAAMLLDSSLSRTRRMKGLIVLMFCEQWSIRSEHLKDREAVHNLCESNGIALCKQLTTHENPDPDGKREKKRKGKHSRKHKKRRKHTRRTSSDSDMSKDLMDQSDTDDVVTTSQHTQDAGEVWDLASKPYKVVTAFRDISEHILSICACIRFDAYVKAHG